MCAMSIILVAFASVKVAFYSVTLALFSRASGLIWTKYTFAKYPFVNLHYVSINLLSILNKEMVNFGHGVNVVSDGSLCGVIMDGKNREK